MRMFIAFLLFFNGSPVFCQVVPGITMDSVIRKLMPVFAEANEQGLLDLPRDSTWNDLATYETAALHFKTPSNWLKLGSLGSIVEVAFDGTGRYFADSFNTAPLLVGAFLLNIPGSSLDEARDLTLQQYRTNADRVFEDDYRDSVLGYKLPGGKKGYLLHTRFLRRSNKLNQSRYDLVLFSDNLQKAYSVMLSVQYKDPGYTFETAYALHQLAYRLFSYVLLR